MFLINRVIRPSELSHGNGLFPGSHIIWEWDHAMLAWQQQMAIACTMTANYRWFIKYPTFRGQTHDQEAAVQPDLLLWEKQLFLSLSFIHNCTSLVLRPVWNFRMGLGMRLIMHQTQTLILVLQKKSHTPRKLKTTYTSSTWQIEEHF